MSEDENQESDEPPEHFQRFRQQMMEDQFAERRVGKFAGAGPQGSRMRSYEDLPDEPEALKRMYLELQRTLRDTHAHHQNEKEKLRWGDEETVEDVLGHLWRRGLELAGVLAALAFITTLFAPESVSEQQRILGIVALTAFWERYLRDFAHTFGQEVTNRM